MTGFIMLTKYDRNRFDDVDRKVHVNAAMIALVERTGPSTAVTLQNVLEALHVKETPAEILALMEPHPRAAAS